MPAARPLGAALLAAGLTLTACASDEPTVTSDAPATGVPSPTDAPAGSSPGAGSPNGAGAPPASPEPGATLTPRPEPSPSVPSVLDFEARTVSGATFRGASVAGQPVLLWFWAPWCAVCRSQVPLVEELARTHGGELAVIGVGSLDSADAIEDFADDTEGVTQLSDAQGALWRRFGIAEQSSFVVLDASGREVHRSGYDDDAGVTAAVESALD